MKVFGTEVNTSTMSIEELKEKRKKVQELLSKLDHQIKIRTIIKHRHPPKSN